MSNKHICHSALILICLCAFLLCLPVSAQNVPWGAAMGQSGLRRLYSTGGDLGELLNRQVSYRAANRIGDASSDVEGYVWQWDSLLPVRENRERPLLFRSLARIAKRFETGKVDGRNDRFDFGVLYAPTRRSYIGAGFAYEHTDADLMFANGTTDSNGVGPRFDAGLILIPSLALGVRVEELRFDGETQVAVRTPGGTLTVDRDVEFQRRFLHGELMGRYGRGQLKFLPARVQLGWMGGVQYLDTHYEPQIDSRGQPVVEPFGNTERLGIVRAGSFLGATLGRRSNWSANIELMFDHEFNTNMNRPIDDRTSRYVRGGLAYIVRPGKRIQFDYQGFRSLDGLRSRDNFTLAGIIDF